MAKYEILIGGKDQSEAHRYNKGDILAVKLYPWNWGKKEIELGLIVIVESIKTFNEMQAYNGAIYEHKTTKTQITKQQLYALDLDEQDDYQLYKKCHSKIDLTELRKTITDLNDSKMEDENIIYQPCKKASQLVKKFDGKNNNRLVEEKDVDTVSSIGGKEEEIVINETVNLIKSNIG